MEKIWGVSMEVAKEYARQHNIQYINRMYNRQDSNMTEKVRY